MAEEGIIGAFSEHDAESLTGVSIGQLRAWDSKGFLVPSYAPANRRQAYSRVYSFRDIVSLRVLNSLRNEHKVSLQHLKKVSLELAHLGDTLWTAQTLYVLARRVVFVDPRTKQRREVVDGQRVFDIPLRIAIKDTKAAIRKLNTRGKSEFGHIVSKRFVMNNRPTFEGTRVLVAAVERYIDAGYDTSQILQEFSELRKKDIEAVRMKMKATAA